MSPMTFLRALPIGLVLAAMQDPAPTQVFGSSIDVVSVDVLVVDVDKDGRPIPIRRRRISR